jgi:hypothetical protein
VRRLGRKKADTDRDREPARGDRDGETRQGEGDKAGETETRWVETWDGGRDTGMGRHTWVTDGDGEEDMWQKQRCSQERNRGDRIETSKREIYG